MTVRKLPAGHVKVVVTERTQVNYQGTVYDGGETLDVPESVAHEWITDGWVSAV